MQVITPNSQQRVLVTQAELHKMFEALYGGIVFSLLDSGLLSWDERIFSTIQEHGAKHVRAFLRGGAF